MQDSLYQLLYARDIFSDEYLDIDSLRFPAPLDTVRRDATIRFKGHSTRYFDKKPYRIKFGSNFSTPSGPARSINLNPMYTDKSFVREAFCWLAYKDIATFTPTTQYVTLTMNGNYKGVFLQIDKIDKYFLPNKGGIRAPLYEADDYYTRGDLTIQPDSLLRKYYAEEIEGGYSDLSQMITAINTADSASFPAVIDTLFDMRSVLQWFVLNILTQSGDSYNKNYYLYRDTSRVNCQWTIIPWDYDLSMGRTGDETLPYPTSLLNDLFAYTFGPLSGPHNVLKDRFARSPVLMGRLRSYLDSLLTTVWTEEKLCDRIDSLASLVQPYVSPDPQKWGTADEFAEQVEALKYYIVVRRNYLISTFTRPIGGDYHVGTIHRPATVGTPYHAIAVDGRQVASITFTDLGSPVLIDSIRVTVHSDSLPPHLPSNSGFINRWIEFKTYSVPEGSGIWEGIVQMSWNEYAQSGSEVRISNEKNLKGFYYDLGYIELPNAHLNAYGNFVNARLWSGNVEGPNRFIALFAPLPAGVGADPIAASFELHQNYPNPFNPATTIRFTLPGTTDVRLCVYDVLGREVAIPVSETKGAGAHEVRFDGSGLSSGVYFYRLTAGDWVATKRFLLLR